MARVTPWARPIRLTASGRWLVVCRFDPAHKFWLTTAERRAWSVCPHCVGWWQWPPRGDTVPALDHHNPAGAPVDPNPAASV